ncbi:hypothetical protein U1Q18_051008 [Sarracenia purpurea var. burkii]
MKILAALVVFIVLFEGIEPRPNPSTGIALRYSSVKPTNRYYDSDADDGYSINDSPIDHDYIRKTGVC